MNWWCAIANLELNFDANENQDLSSQTLADVPHTRVCENRKKAHIFIKNVNNQIIVHIQCSSFGCLQSLLFGTHSSCGSRQYIVISSVKIIANNSHKFYFIFILVLLKREIDTRTHTHIQWTYTYIHTLPFDEYGECNVAVATAATLCFCYLHRNYLVRSRYKFVCVCILHRDRVQNTQRSEKKRDTCNAI